MRTLYFSRRVGAPLQAGGHSVESGVTHKSSFEVRVSEFTLVKRNETLVNGYCPPAQERKRSSVKFLSFSLLICIIFSFLEPGECQYRDIDCHSLLLDCCGLPQDRHCNAITDIATITAQRDERWSVSRNNGLIW